MTTRGQALLEFILILPILLMMFVGIADYGHIIYEKHKLENVMGNIIEMLELNYDVEAIKLELLNKEGEHFYFEIKEGTNYREVYLHNDVKLYTLGVDWVFPNPFPLKTKRVLYRE